MRLLIDDVRMSGSNVQIRLRISLDPLDPCLTGARPTRKPTPVPAQRPTKTVCVPSVVINGPSYRLKKTVCVPSVVINGPSYRLKDRLTLGAAGETMP